MKKKILIVEDEGTVRLLLEECLSSFKENGVDILVACDGQEGLELAKRERPDLIFLDIMLPKMRGYEVCEEIKKDPRLQGTSVIFLTALGHAFDNVMGKKVGCTDCITKPFDIKKLIKKTEDILDVKSGWNL